MKIMKFEISKQAMINAGVVFGLAAVAILLPDAALADPGTTLGTSTAPSKGITNLVYETSGNLAAVLPAFSAAAYLGGTIFAVSTLLDAKKYSEDPGQFKGGIPKIVVKGAVAAGLFSLPTVTATVASTFFTATGNQGYNQLNANLSTGTPTPGSAPH